MPNFNISSDGWLAGFLGGEVYRLSPLENAPLDDLQQLRQIMERPKPVFLYAKIPCTWLKVVASCEEEGFRLVDTQLTFERTAATALKDSRPHVHEVRLARPADRAGVGALARESFSFSRFHLDPMIPRDVANAIKEGWAVNYFEGKRGDLMIVAADGEKIAGFLLALTPDSETAVIDLIAVDAAYRRQGLGCAMIEYVQEVTARPRLRVGTQAANCASVRMYEKMGFRLCDSAYVLHYHNTVRRRTT